MICKRIIRGALFSRNHCRNGGSCRAPGTTVGSCVQARSLSTLFVEKELYNQFTIVEKRGITDGTELDAILDEMRATGDVYTRSEDLAKAVEEATYDTLDMRKRALMNEDDLRPYEALVAAHHTSLFARQLHMEQEQQSDAVEEYNESLKQLIVMGRGTGLKYVQRVLLRWYEPLTRVIDAEMSLIEARTSGQDRLQYGPCMLLLPAEKLAVITLDECLNSVLKVGNAGVQLTSLSRRIGDVIEAEVAIIKLQKGKKGLRPWQQDLIKKAYAEPSFRKTRQKINQLVEEETWANELKVKVGAALISFMLDSAKTDMDTPAFLYSKKMSAKGTFKRVGILMLDESQYKEISTKEASSISPRHLPMLIPPKLWDNKNLRDGCYFRLRASIMRTVSNAQTDALRRANMDGVLEGLDYLGQVGWRVNCPIVTLIKTAYNRKYHIGDLPGKDLILPEKDDCIRIVTKRVYKTVFTFKNKEEKLDLENTNDGDSPLFLSEDLDMSAWENDDKEIKEKKDPNMPKIEEPDPLIPRFDEKYYNDLCRRVNMKNSAMHSLRCDLHLKFWVADKFLDDVFYYPYNLDFRGRAYPVPPNLNHLGSDMCRAMLWFDEAKPLGENGLFWMKVHLSNLFGNNKIPHNERVAFVDANIDKVIACALDPFGDNKVGSDGKIVGADGTYAERDEIWWSKADEPFQALATIIEIANAIKLKDPSQYMCRLPIHQDGSCNGLQHYAALGRDAVGASAVNVRPSVRPQDVYTSVLDIVRMKIAVDVKVPKDAANDADRLRGQHARMVQDVVDRKVIKQTVMTSVYGVTKVGARAQIQARLQERLLTDPSKMPSPEMERELFGASSYLANLTLESLQEMFTGAKDIMDWLGNCASLVASQGQAMAWVTPLGLPVMQPYRKTATHTVRTILQSITLSLDDDALPVSKQKQRSAFPPNFVHSLDATHMLMTTLKMKEKKITFAAVHDSYWTHANDIPAMNKSIRECFYDLYEQPILETLRESLSIRYPDVHFPPVPERGTLDLSSVKIEVTVSE